MTDSTRPVSPRSRALRQRYLLTTVIGGVLILCALTSLATSLNQACGSCHAMKPYAKSLESGKHKGVSCYSCHANEGLISWPAFKFDEFTRMYPAGLVGGKVTGPGIRLSRKGCLNCHADVLKNVVNSKGLRIEHFVCTTDLLCDQCHSATAHGKATRWVRAPVMDDCIRCHLARRASTRCDACHAAKGTSERLARGPWQVTHGPNWRSSHGMGDTNLCSTCHPPDYCVRCHGTPLPHAVDFGGNHGEAARYPDSKCTGCHNRKKFCDACHGVDMPHPAGYLKVHTKIAKGVKDPVCLKCHSAGDCLSCHLKHTHPGTTEGTLGGAKLPVMAP